MGKLIQIILGISLAAPALAQSAANFHPQILAPAAAPEVKEATPEAPATIAKEPGPAGNKPSRNVSPDEMQAYLDAVLSVFSSRGRATDPFGQLQDPEAKPLVKATPKGPVRQAVIKVTPFPDIVALLEINTIMPASKSFLIKSRTVKQGEVLPLSFRNKTIRAHITAVSARQIDFRNLETGETATRTIDLLPVGMTPGTRGIIAPGMTADQPDAPVQLDAGDTAP